MLSWLSSVAGRVTLVDSVILAGALGIILYWLGTRTHDYFRRRGLPYMRPVMPFLGNMTSVLTGRVSWIDFLNNLYNKFEGYQAVGFFSSMTPTVFIRDPELIKMMTVKEFDHFTDHQDFISEKVEPMFARNLFALKGVEWRDMRATLSPAFTSSKMRNIFKLMNLCGEQMVTFLEKKVNGSKGGVFEAEMKDFFTRFANDVIATSAFGIECDSLGQPNNEFYKMGRELTNTKGIKALIFMGYLFSPKFMEMLGIPVNSSRVRNFFHNIVHDTIGERVAKGIFRPDMIQLLMQAREGKLKAEAEDEQENINGAQTKKLTDQDITAQAVIFFFAGFDTVSMAMSFCALALARHPDAQERVQREVDEVFDKHEGKLTYEAAQELKYTDMFINEVLRLYATLPNLDRKCTKDFTIPAQGDVPAYTVRKGDVVWIPVFPIHHDPKYWDEPETFDPERFNEENKQKIKPFTFFPFGVGPRICIGFRFALLEMKVALAYILRHFNVQATSKTPKKIEYEYDFSGSIKGGFWVGFTPRSK